MKAWYLVYSKAKQEWIAKAHLERQKYETYLPLVSLRRHKQGRLNTVIVPMFPRYLFVSLCDQTDDWSPIRSTIGVSNLVRVAQQPARVPDSLIASLKQREDKDGIQVVPARECRPGDAVRIIEGPFEGYDAIFKANSSKDRIIILLGIAEKMINIQINRESVEALT